jgi:hypothetical protein
MSIEHTEQSEAPAAPAESVAPAGPRGIGTAVAFDWGLTAQLAIEAPLFALGIGPGSAMAGQPLAMRLGAAALYLIFAAITFALGEGVRRGRRLFWLFQIAINALLFLGGFPVLIGALQDLGHGHVGGLIPALIMLIASPAAAILLSSKRTRAWITTTTSAEARKRHGGKWPWLIAIWAIVGGALVAFSGSF